MAIPLTPPATNSALVRNITEPNDNKKDNRTGHEEVDVNAVMNGNIDNFLYSYLQQEAKNNG